jgi:DNA-binding CsgD family transcriptional regulator
VLRLIEGRTHDSLVGSSVFALIVIDGLTEHDLVSAEQFEENDRSVPGFLMPAHGVHWAQRGDIDTVPPPTLLTSLATRSELAAMFDDPEVAADLAARLRPHADLFVTGGASTLVNFGSARTYLGIALAASGHLDDAVRELRKGIAANEIARSPPYAALAGFELARILARRRRPRDLDEAAALCASVATAAEQLGMTPLHRRAGELAATIRGDRPSGLTRREAEVAAYVAQGLTNRQIAALMHISERTVESHVQHTLTKLGFSNRTQVAAWAAEQR